MLSSLEHYPVLGMSQNATLSQESYSILGPGLGDFKVDFSRRGVIGIGEHTEAQILKQDLTWWKAAKSW